MKSEKQLRVLVCDPDPLCRRMIQEFLLDSPIRVAFTESLEATSRAQRSFNVVVIDVPNPARNSCGDVVKAAKRVAPRAPVIITSRLADEFLWTEALSQGAYDLLPKPMHKAEFLRVVLGAVKEIQAA